MIIGILPETFPSFGIAKLQGQILTELSELSVEMSESQVSQRYTIKFSFYLPLVSITSLCLITWNL
jgi:hypothetical protein